KISRPRVRPIATTTPMVTTVYAVTRIQRAGAKNWRNRTCRFRSRSIQFSAWGLAPSAGRLRRRSQTERTGTRELEGVNDAIIEKPTASESGTNSERETPIMKNDGT